MTPAAETDTTPSTEPEAKAEESLLTSAPKEEPKVEAEPPAEPLALDKLTIPEGVQIDPVLGKSFTDILNNAELKPAERAQALLDLQVEAAKQASEKASEAWGTQRQTWRDQVTADPEIGGAKLEENLGKVSKLLDAYGTPDLRQAFDDLGAGDHPAIVGFLVKLANAHGESTPAIGAPPTAQLTEAERAARMYPSMSQGN